jgi:hypothetical protein
MQPFGGTLGLRDTARSLGPIPLLDCCSRSANSPQRVEWRFTRIHLLFSLLILEHAEYVSS